MSRPWKRWRAGTGEGSAVTPRPPLQPAADDDGVCDGVMIRVAEADHHFPDAAFPGKLQRSAMQDGKRFARGLAAHFDVPPAHAAADARAERFRDRFLRREPRREMPGGVFHGIAIGDLVLEEDAVQEPLAKALEGRLDPRRLHHVDSYAQDVHRMSASISATAVSSPTKRARETMEWPIFSSARWGIVLMTAMFE